MRERRSRGVRRRRRRRHQVDTPVIRPQLPMRMVRACGPGSPPSHRHGCPEARSEEVAQGRSRQAPGPIRALAASLVSAMIVASSPSPAMTRKAWSCSSRCSRAAALSSEVARSALPPSSPSSPRHRGRAAHNRRRPGGLRPVRATRNAALDVVGAQAQVAGEEVAGATREQAQGVSVPASAAATAHRAVPPRHATRSTPSASAARARAGPRSPGWSAGTPAPPNRVAWRPRTAGARPRRGCRPSWG